MVLTGHMGDATSPVSSVDAWAVNDSNGTDSEVFTDEMAEKATHFAPAAFDVGPLSKNKNVRKPNDE